MSKYYIPDISEFYIGFEYEKWVTEEQEYRTFEILKVVDINNAWVKLKAVGMRGVGWEIRVKHLDIENILSFGFTLVDDYDGVGQATFEKGEWFVIWTRDVTEIHYGEDMVFCGKIKNKSEFKRILNQVNIYENSSSNELEKAW